MKKRRKVKKKLLAYTLTLCCTLLILGIIYFAYSIFFKNKTPELSFLETIDTSTYVEIDKYAIYGIHMNFEGTFTLPEKVEEMRLLLSNGKDTINVNWEITEEENNTYSFITSEYINEGIVLENLPIGEYYLVLQAKTHDEEQNEVIKYYSVINNTEYENLEYYTLTENGKNNKIDIEWNTYEEIPTLRFKITETKLPDDVYDITIDPGHGGVDPGKTACSDGSATNSLGYCYSGDLITEAAQNLKVALQLKENLENLGYKVILTRETDENVSIYDPMGSATMANDTKSKFNIAIHHNSSGVGSVSGLEVYIANDTNLDFASTFVDEITKNANTEASTKALYQVSNGIYQRLFTEEEIASSSVQPSRYTTNTSWYYNMREIGGISTNASNDGSFPGYPMNEHYNSNNTAEAYLLELGYMDNYSDLRNIMQNTEGYAQGITSAIETYLNQE